MSDVGLQCGNTALDQCVIQEDRPPEHRALWQGDRAVFAAQPCSAQGTLCVPLQGSRWLTMVFSVEFPPSFARCSPFTSSPASGLQVYKPFSRRNCPCFQWAAGLTPHCQRACAIPKGWPLAPRGRLPYRAPVVLFSGQNVPCEHVSGQFVQSRCVF